MDVASQPGKIVLMPGLTWNLRPLGRPRKAKTVPDTFSYLTFSYLFLPLFLPCFCPVPTAQRRRSRHHDRFENVAAL